MEEKKTSVNGKDSNLILYVQTSEEPQRQYSPLVLAQSASSMALTPKLYFIGQGIKILVPGVAEKIKLGNFPSVFEMLEKTMDMGIEVLACEVSKRMFGWEKVELIEGINIVGAHTLNELALKAGATMWF